MDTEEIIEKMLLDNLDESKKIAEEIVKLLQVKCQSDIMLAVQSVSLVLEAMTNLLNESSENEE